MPDRLKHEILDRIINKTGLKEKTVRNKIAAIRKDNAALTMNAAAQVLADNYGFSFRPKLGQDDKHALAQYQQAKNITNNINNTYHTKHDNRLTTLIGETFTNTVVGDNNSNNKQQVGLLDDAIADLLENINHTEALSPEDKNDYAAEIGTIYSQSKKTQPDKSTIQKAWSAIKVLSAVAGLASSIFKVEQILQQLGLI